MGMISMVGIGQGWDVLREPGLGKVFTPTWKYPEYNELQQQEIAVQITECFFFTGTPLKSLSMENLG